MTTTPTPTAAKLHEPVSIPLDGRPITVFIEFSDGGIPLMSVPLGTLDLTGVRVSLSMKGLLLQLELPKGALPSVPILN